MLFGIFNLAIAQRSASSVGFGGFSPSYNSVDRGSELKSSGDVSVDTSKGAGTSDAVDKSLLDVKQKCLDLGFIASTEQYSKCILRLSK